MTQILDPLTSAKICINFKLYGSVIFLLIFALVGFIAPRNNFLSKLEVLFNSLARKRKESVIIVGIITFLSTMAVSFIFYWPVPTIQDEFGYLLSGDTFAHGRLTNPPHPMWISLETFHVLQQPTYASKYPPGQGLILAFGQVIAGHSIFGVWLSIALGCAATCWMLQAWLPPKWALLGGFLMMLRLALFSYWGQSYWGGAVALIGGALVFGALRRLTRKTSITLSIIFALGLIILANTRPYEGAVVGFIATLFLFIKIRPFSGKLLKEVVLPMGIILFLFGLGMAYYNFVITGNPFYFPYRAYEAAYGNIPNFLWATPLPNATYNHEEIKETFQVIYMNIYKSHIDTLPHYLTWCLFKLGKQWRFFVEWVFTFPLLVLPFLLKNSWVRFALITVLTLIVAMMVVAFNFGHYSAPAVCLLYFLVLQCLRKIRFFYLKRKPIGQFMSWSIPFYSISLIFLPIVLGSDPFYYVNPSPWESSPRTLPNVWSLKRANLLSELSKTEGKHLIVVRYLPGHNVEHEWVYNEADIDASKVVWARNMTKDRNCQLVKYFYDRQAWLLEIDSTTEEYKILPFKACQ
jgi:hypothetical protein